VKVNLHCSICIQQHVHKQLAETTQIQSTEVVVFMQDNKDTMQLWPRPRYYNSINAP